MKYNTIENYIVMVLVLSFIGWYAMPRYINSGAKYFALKHDKYGRYCGYEHFTFPLMPVDAIDSCCMVHDICVTFWGMEDIPCHKRLLTCIREIKKEPYFYVGNSTIADKIFRTADKAENCIKVFETINSDSVAEVTKIGATALLNLVIPGFSIIEMFAILFTSVSSISYVDQVNQCKELIEIVLK